MSVDTSTEAVERSARMMAAFSPVQAAQLQALAQERDALAERSRWNIREEGGDLLVCRGDHHRAEKCEWERYVPEAERDAARAEVARLRLALRAMAEKVGE